MRRLFGRQVVLGAALVATAVANPFANHSWGSYHWARTTEVVTLKTGDNVDSRWDAYLDEAISDWNASAVVKLAKVAGGTNPKNCRPTSGRIEVCNAKYGQTGWLGIAQIWASGSHITQAISKLNDTYFDTATYNKPAWRRLVMCQEVAHDFGLGHQDEIFDNANLGSCMDYTNDPDGTRFGQASNEHPNGHDFDQLLTIYGSHRDSTNTAAASLPNGSAAGDDHHPSQWGRLVHSSPNGRVQIYELGLGRGQKKITHVFWADPERDAHHH
ncbi:MAG TPA: hypothetical protein VM364_06890 [Vicinamibacterales bacterium]|nr:hypothetical protein [Vicinamibacterales bacterium]